DVEAARVEVILVGAIGRALAVHVILVDLQLRLALDLARGLGGRVHDPVAGLIPDHQVIGAGDLRRGIFRVGVVHVETRTRRGDDVGDAHRVRVIAGGRAGTVAAQVEATGVAQRGLRVIVPAGPAVHALSGDLCVGNDRLRARVHRACFRGVDGDDAELRLGAEHVAGGL